jgi:hypothetical protein
MNAWHGATVSEPRSTSHEPDIRSADERAEVAACDCLPFVVLAARVLIELMLLRV